MHKSPPRLFLICVAVASLAAETLTLPPERRPEWLRREGIVMAGDWEPLLFRVRRDGAPGYTPTPEQLAAYRREHSPEMIARLKALGVNFVMIHCYKGAGINAERQSMADAAEFAGRCRTAGLHVGVYVTSGTMLWELFYKEKPEAKDWAVLTADGKPITYPWGRGEFRYFWNRNHPDAEAYHQKIVRYAVEEIHADLLHFDNYGIGPGWDACSVDRFRRYLRETFTPPQRTVMGAADLDHILPPKPGTQGMLQCAWRRLLLRITGRVLLSYDPLRPNATAGHPHGVQPRWDRAADRAAHRPWPLDPRRRRLLGRGRAAQLPR